MSARAGANRAKLEIEGSCRQQRRGDVGACHRRDAIVRHEDEVIGGARADRGCDKRSAARAELVGVDARLQAGGAACPQDALRFLRREDAGLAKDVAPARQLRRRHRGNHVVDDDVDVSVAIAAMLARDLVRAHERRYDVDRMRFANPGDRAQHLQLALEVEAVTTLDLAGGRTAGEHPVEPRPGLGDQIFLAGGARRRDRGHDAATGGGDAGIGFTGEAPAQFRTAVAGVDGVRVGVDEAGNDREVADVDNARVRRQRQGAFELAGGAGECDPLARDGERAVGDDLELSLPGSAARRGPGAGNELTAVPEDQHACRQPRSSAARGASLDHCAGAAGASAWRGRCSRTLSSDRSCSRMNSSAR